jgi:hypothetical protein
MSRPKRISEPRTEGTLLKRSQDIIALYDAEDKGYAFGDSGDAEMYADEMADLLEFWIALVNEGPGATT